MTTLISSTGLSARILTLPGREPFMLAADLAEAYGTETRAVVQAVNRHPLRFPSDFAFQLSAAELGSLRSQKVISDQTRYGPLAFTRAGALALSGVLKTPLAAEVSVTVHRAFAAMEQRAYARLHALVAGIRTDAVAAKPIYAKVRLAASEGMSFLALWRRTSYSKAKLALAVHEMVEQKLLAEPLAHTPPPMEV